MVVHVLVEWGEGDGGDKVRAPASLCTQPHTVEPQFNEVPRDWENLLVISRARYIENLDFTNGKTSKMFIILTCS